MNTTDKNENKLRIAIYKKSFNNVDPAIIKSATDANINRALYSTLFYYNENGVLNQSLVDKYEVRDKLLILTIREDVKTIDGYKITADDVIFSFKRLLILNTNTHGKLEYYLDLNTVPKSIESECSCINLENNKVVFHLKNEKFVSSFITILANPDYAVIPKISVNQKSLKIIDYKNTSGPYYLIIGPDNRFLMKRNSDHYLLYKNSANVIEFFEIETTDEAIDNVLNNKIDFIPTFFGIADDSVEKLKTNYELNIHSTLPIMLTFIRFTDTGIKKYNIEQRIHIASYFKAMYLKYFSNRMHFIETVEYFSTVGRGGLNKEQVQILRTKLAQSNYADFFKKVRPREGSFKKSTGDEFIKSIGMDSNFNEYFDEKNKEIPADFDTITSDSGFFDNFTFLGYLQSRKLINMSDKEFSDWLFQYVNESDESNKEKMINRIHFDLLNSGIVFPIGFSKYHAIARKPWKLIAPKMYAGTPLWMIRKE